MSSISAAKPTILDVARHCGLSKATVSKALNATADSSLVSKATRAKVVRAAKTLGYRPNWRATMLARQKSQTIAIAYSAPVGAVPRGVYWEVVDSLEEQLGHRDYIPTFLHIRHADQRVDEMLGNGRFDGLISLGIITPGVLDMVREHRLPCVLINSSADATWSRVNVNDLQGGRDAMRHLIALGHRHVIYYAGATILDHPSAHHRYEAYRSSMEEAGLTPRPPLVCSPDQVIEFVRASKKQTPTAVVDFEHWSAIRLLQACWRHGVTVPGDLSVVTFNDTNPVADVIPPLSAVALPGRKMAEVAVELLMRQIEQSNLPPETVVLDEELVVRASTGVPKT